MVPERKVPRPRPTDAGDLLERTGLDQRRTLVGSHHCTFFPYGVVARPLPCVQNALTGACPRLPVAVSGKPTTLRCCAGKRDRRRPGDNRKTVSAHLHQVRRKQRLYSEDTLQITRPCRGSRAAALTAKTPTTTPSSSNGGRGSTPMFGQPGSSLCLPRCPFWAGKRRLSRIHFAEITSAYISQQHCVIPVEIVHQCLLC